MSFKLDSKADWFSNLYLACCYIHPEVELETLLRFHSPCLMQCQCDLADFCRRKLIWAYLTLKVTSSADVTFAVWLRVLARHHAPRLCWWGVPSLSLDRPGSPKICDLVFLRDPGDTAAVERQGNTDRRSLRSSECSGLHAVLGGLSQLQCENHTSK